MQLLYTSTTSKKKKRKPNAKQRELQASWEAILKKYESKKPIRAISTPVRSPVVSNVVRRETEHYPSLNTNVGSATKAPPKVYTGDKVLGIAVMHKSNAVPIFKEEDAIDIARMRR